MSLDGASERHDAVESSSLRSWRGWGFVYLIGGELSVVDRVDPCHRRHGHNLPKRPFTFAHIVMSGRVAGTLGRRRLEAAAARRG